MAKMTKEQVDGVKAYFKFIAVIYAIYAASVVVLYHGRELADWFSKRWTGFKKFLGLKTHYEMENKDKELEWSEMD